MTEIMVGSCSELADGDYRIVAVGELEVGIFRLGERFVAYENRCPHHGGPVCQGRLFNGVEEIIMPDQTSRGLRFTKDRHVVCPWHGYEFNLDTGRHPGDPRVRLRPCGTYRYQYSGGNVAGQCRTITVRPSGARTA